MKKVAVLGAIIIGFVGFNALADAAYDHKQVAQENGKWRDATEAELKKLRHNRTVTSTYRRSGDTMKVYFSADGKLEGTCCEPSWNRQWSGTWKVKGSQACMTFNSGKVKCAHYLTDGKSFTNGKSFRPKGRKSAFSKKVWEEGNKLP